MQRYRLQAPTGAEIIGTEETVSAVALIANVRPDGKGGFDFERTGETHIEEDHLESVLSQGEVVYRDEHGSLWLHRELILVPAGPSDTETGGKKISVSTR